MKLCFFISLFLLSFLAHTQALIPFGFWHQRVLAITTAAQTLHPNVCSTVITVQTNRGGKANIAQTVTTVNLAATVGTLGFYSDPACTTSIASVNVAANASSATFYVMATAVESTTFTVTANGYQPAEQTNNSAVNPYVWTGTTSNDWEVGTNWSGGSAPSNSQVAYFDGTCTVNCAPALSANVNAGGVKVMPTFTGSINQGAFTLTVQARGWVQLGGTFNGDTVTGKMFDATNGPYYLSTGATYTASSGITRSGLYWIINGTPTFNHSNGTLNFNYGYANHIVQPGTVNYKNVELSGTFSLWDLTGTWTITGNFVASQGHAFASRINGGQIDLSGDLLVSNGGGIRGTTLVQFVGPLAQNLDTTGTLATNPAVPGIKINTASTVSYFGIFYTESEYTVTSGTVVPGAATITLEVGYTTKTFTFGSETYQNFTISGAAGSFTLVNTLKVAGDLTLTTYNAYNLTFNAGTIEAAKDVYVLGFGVKGPGLLKLVGTVNQKIDASGASVSTQGPNLPNVNIANTGGNNVTLLGTLNYADNWIVDSGTIVGGTSTLNNWGYSSSRTFTPGVGSTYHHVILSNWYNNQTYNITGSLTATGDVTLGYGAAGSVDPFHMPNPGVAYSINVTGTLTIRTFTSLNLYGASLTYGALVNNGTIVP